MLGHQAGDRALRAVAAVLEAETRRARSPPAKQDDDVVIGNVVAGFGDHGRCGQDARR